MTGLISQAAQGLRMAGSALGGYLSNPATYKDLGKKVALETALGTAAQQAVPRMLGVQAPPLGRSAMNVAINSAFTNPITGATKAMGAPEWAANMAGSIVGGAGASVVSDRIANQIADPEPHQAPQANLAQYMELQKMHAAMENERYKNEINLAYAKNYRDPTVLIHKNPSADIESVSRMLSKNYY